MTKEVYPKQFFSTSCKECECVAVTSGKDATGLDSEMFCSGVIRWKHKPTNSHDKANRIRFCMVKDGEGKVRGIKTWEVTEWETTQIIRCLDVALSRSLERLQQGG